MTNREAIAKALIWRFFVAIPLSMIITLLYVGSMGVAVKITIVTNILSTILYYLFDIAWFKYFRDAKGEGDKKP